LTQSAIEQCGEQPRSVDAVGSVRPADAATVISRLSDQNVILAQRLALLEAKLRDD